jgi:peptidoglycan biosynthesis protein MviN/MurJ (putative lipid II flippase)
VPGLALAHSAGFAVGSVVLGVLVARRVGGLERGGTALEMAKATLAAVAAAAAMLAAANAVASVLGPGDLRSLTQLAAAGTAGLAVFVVVARGLRARELDAFRRLLPG